MSWSEYVSKLDAHRKWWPTSQPDRRNRLLMKRRLVTSRPLTVFGAALLPLLLITPLIVYFATRGGEVREGDEESGVTTAEGPANEPALSVFSRGRQRSDDSPHGHAVRNAFAGVPALDIRLAFASEQHEIFVGRFDDPAGKVIPPGSGRGVCFLIHPGGGGCGPLSNLKRDGAIVFWGSSSQRPGYTVSGLIPDGVTAVRVGNTQAVLGQNVFMATVASLGDPVVLTTADGTERSVPVPPAAPPSDAAGGGELRPDPR
jgi:hypothetical protein